MLSRLSNPSEASAISFRVKTAKPKSHVARSMVNYDKIYIHSGSIPEIQQNISNNEQSIRKSVVVETLAEN